MRCQRSSGAGPEEGQEVPAAPGRWEHAGKQLPHLIGKAWEGALCTWSWPWPHERPHEIPKHPPGEWGQEANFYLARAHGTKGGGVHFGSTARVSASLGARLVCMAGAEG